MRRTTTGRSAAMVASSKGEQGFWPSYADMMSAVALILFFLMLLSYIQNLVTGNDLQNTQGLLDDTRAALALTEVEMEEAQNKLQLITTELDGAQIELEKQKGIIADQEALIGDQKSLMAELQVLTDEQAMYLAATNEEILSLRGQMQTIAVLRLSILEQIKSSIEDVMGSGGSVSIGENGSIILSEGVLFDWSSSEIKDDSKPMLDELAQVFGKFLANSENAKYVDSIVISGHTDSSGTDEVNRSLSSERANNVLGYLLGANNSSLNRFAKYFCAAGYGANRPVASNATADGRSANRRIEISIILKDETVLDIVDNYLAIEPPTGAEN